MLKEFKEIRRLAAEKKYLKLFDYTYKHYAPSDAFHTNSDIINDVPVTTNIDECRLIIDDKLITDLDGKKMQDVLAWIKSSIRPQKSPNRYHTSYGIKHCLQSQAGIYVTNNQFKHAMLLCGFTPVDKKALNWQYCISEKSPCFK